MSAPVPVAGLLESFFTDRLMRERRASPHTIAAYRDAFRLLLSFVQARLRKAPSAAMLADLDAPLISAFLDDLERARGSSARTRNAQLAAIHSFFRYVALREPAHAGLIQRVLAMPIVGLWLETPPVQITPTAEIDRPNDSEIAPAFNAVSH